ncbi:MAG: hypothetical protein IIW34_02430 [Clostridia bacterium]|nr:hypothetical protein [Clostridia bacterium]
MQSLLSAAVVSAVVVSQQGVVSFAGDSQRGDWQGLLQVNIKKKDAEYHHWMTALCLLIVYGYILNVFL